jgi:HK97 family phage major capsid protein
MNFTGLEEKRSALIRSGQGILDRCLRENRAMRPAESVDLEGIESKLSEIDKTIGKASVFGRDNGEPGATFIRSAVALAANNGNLEAAARHAAVRYPGDRDLSRALSASVATGGGYAIPQGYSDEIIAALRPLSSVRRLGPTIVPMPSGSLVWPKITTGASVPYVSEGAQLSESDPAFGALVLSAKKMSCFVPISNSLLRYASPAADQIVRADLVAAVAATEDYNFLRGDGTANTPRGLRNWALTSNVVGFSGSSDIPTIDTALASLESLLTGANVPMQKPGWILSPRTAGFLRSLRSTTGVRAFPEMNDGLLKGWPYAVSSNVQVNLGTGSQTEIYLCDFSDCVIGEFPLVIDAGNSANYKDPSGSTISAFAQDQTLIRVVCQSDIGLRHRESLAILTAVPF